MEPKPTPQQVAWQEAELTMFLHFGMNTFTDREWGDGKEAQNSSTRPHWMRTSGCRRQRPPGSSTWILTTKHHNSCYLWPSKYTEHSVKNSPWRDGKGDVVSGITNACHKARLEGRPLPLAVGSP